MIHRATFRYGGKGVTFQNGGALPMAAVAEPMGDAIHQDLPPGWWLCRNAGIKNRAQNRACSAIKETGQYDCIP